MKYTVTAFNSGMPIWDGTVVATSPLQACKAAPVKTFMKVHHFQVVGKKVKRYTAKFVAIPNDVYVFKGYVAGTPAIVLFADRWPEFYRFLSLEDRDKTFQEILCTPSTSAESAKTDEEPTDITASSVETGGSKNGLMCQKISNGFATSVTWQVNLTLSSIGHTSGKDNVSVMEKPAWSVGSEASPSKSSQTFLATVKNIPHNQWGEYPVFVEGMAQLIGKTIEVEESYLASIGGMGYRGKNFLWKKEWLDFRTIHVTVANVPIGTTVDILTFESRMKQYYGKTITMRVCTGSIPTHYTYDGWCFAQEWLVPAEHTPRQDVQALVKANVPVGGDDLNTGIHFHPLMQKFIGHIVTVHPHPTKLGAWQGEGWSWATAWLNFDYATIDMSKWTED